MDVRNAANPKDVCNYGTDRLREDFLIQELFKPGVLKLVYSHIDRIITGGACPVSPLKLEGEKELKTAFFLERREMGIINVGPLGTVIADGKKYELNTRDGLYIGMGTKEITFTSSDPKNPAHFYFLSTPAHCTYPTQKIELGQTEANHLGSITDSNERTIHKYIHPNGVKSCQLVMGMTILEPNNVWNSMPCHTHERRMEVYFYFNLPQDAMIVHFMGQPQETRHVIMHNEEAIISPSWSIHAGVGTKNYTFIWGMAGENQTFNDQDAVAVKDLR
ncbi:MAG TPA: 5-dehydro-4-deoxy-D-glucuronate isomerase [Firmicutes bacterium]|jgi:4-deoxy-L-threo-5-hexosulose-uronate ketol-isomerase|nr:5-dehydro-4-deoxy-D-glucuronate isomerase [Bacillota bacterium]